MGECVRHSQFPSQWQSQSWVREKRKTTRPKKIKTCPYIWANDSYFHSLYRFFKRKFCCRSLENKVFFLSSNQSPLSFCLSVLEKGILWSVTTKEMPEVTQRGKKAIVWSTFNNTTLIPEKQKAGRAIWDEIKHQWVGSRKGVWRMGLCRFLAVLTSEVHKIQHLQCKWPPALHFTRFLQYALSIYLPLPFRSGDLSPSVASYARLICLIVHAFADISWLPTS